MPRWVIGLLAMLAIWYSTFDTAFAGKSIAPGGEFSDCEQCPAMVVVPAGSFTMGSPKNEKGREDDEGPQRKVKIGEAFAVGKFEVTRGQYAAFVADSGQAVADKCWIREKTEWKERSGSYREPGYKQTDDHPVVCVGWHDAKAYVKWLSKKTGGTYRLLSEAEWEYAARAGTTTPYSTGSTITRDQANFNKPLTETTKVGSFAANDYGLNDMHGNVYEWTEDCYHDSYRGAPAGKAPWTTIACKYRVSRGGAFSNNNPRKLRSANRGDHKPGYRSSFLGFRVAKTLTLRKPVRPQPHRVRNESAKVKPSVTKTGGPKESTPPPPFAYKEGSHHSDSDWKKVKPSVTKTGGPKESTPPPPFAYEEDTHHSDSDLKWGH